MAEKGMKTMIQNTLRFAEMAGRATVLAVLALALAAPAAAQSPVTQSDIQRLQDEAFQAGSDVSRLRSSQPQEAERLQADLDELRDEIVYLRVKLRKEGGVTRTEYAQVRDRIQELRSRARGEYGTRQPAGQSPPPVTPPPSDRRTEHSGQHDPVFSGAIPVGTEMDVRLQTTLDSNTAQVEQRFEATTVVDLYRGNDVMIPAGSVVRGVVSSVQPAGRVERRGSMTLSFDQITIRGRNYPMRATVTQALQGEGIKGEAGRIGTGAGVGAVIGGILGGVRGALLGVLIGGGGTIAATEGTDVRLPAGTVLRVRLDSPPDVR
jgi:hypothetical protein